MSAKGAGSGRPAALPARALPGMGPGQPRDDAHLWLAFNLRAHHMQAQAVARRVVEAGESWGELDWLIAEHGLPERTMDAIFDAVLGYRVRRATYLKRADMTGQTASRELAALASAEMPTACSTGCGRYCRAGQPLLRIRERHRSRRRPSHDPHPWMRAKLGRATG